GREQGVQPVAVVGGAVPERARQSPVAGGGVDGFVDSGDGELGAGGVGVAAATGAQGVTDLDPRGVGRASRDQHLVVAGVAVAVDHAQVFAHPLAVGELGAGG